MTSEAPEEEFHDAVPYLAPEDASVTDDGRIDVDLDSHACKAALSVIHWQDEEQEEEELPGPPQSTPFDVKLNIVIQVVGSRGDVQPFIALGSALQKHGHRVRLATHNTFDSFVRDSGLEFFPIGGDPAALMAYMVKNPGLIPKMKSLREGDIQRKREMVAEMLRGCWKSCVEEDPVTGAPFVADAIIANPPSFAHVHCAEALSIPLHLMFTMPWSPTNAIPHPLANLKCSGPNKKFANSMSYGIVEWLTWQGLGDVINAWRSTMDLEQVPTNEGPTLAKTLKVPFTYCWSPALLAKPEDWPAHIDVCGFFFREPPTYTPPTEIKDFLWAGPPPVYIGFGSIVLDDPGRVTAVVEEAVRAAGVRAIVSRGWSNIGGPSTKDILYIGDCPHDWLFERVACVVHHGGAGTTACGLRYGKPTVIVPFFGDQPFWGKIVANSGAGPSPIPQASLTAENLANAIRFCLQPQAMDAAEMIAVRMVEESGVKNAIDSFHRNLPLEGMRCQVLRDQPAVWAYKHRSGVAPIYLSKMATQILLENRRVDEKKLSIHAANPIIIQNRRFDPVSGTTSAVFDTYSGILRASTDVVVKPYQEISRSRSERSDSLASVPSTTPSSSSDQPPPLPPRPGLDRSASSHDWEATGSAVAAGARGVGKIIGRYYKGAFADIPLATTEGFRAIPRLYGEEVEQHVVRDFKSGAAAGGKNFVQGMAGGITGLFTQPVKEGIKHGPLGVPKGFMKGVVGVATKTPAAALGLFAYPAHGFCKSIHIAVRSTTRKQIAAARRDEGEYMVRGPGRVMDRKEVVRSFDDLLKSAAKRGSAQDADIEIPG